MEIDPNYRTHAQIYKIMTGVVVPRPIAWVTTLSENGAVNLAPFSAFSFCCHKPPMVVVSIGDHEVPSARAGKLKDSARNILQRRDFVVNIANQNLLEQLHNSSAEHPKGLSEAEALGLQTASSSAISTPRLAAAPVALECRLHTALVLGEEGQKLMIGEVVRFQIADDLIDNGKVDTVKLNPIARIGGPNYATLGEILTMPPARLHTPASEPGYQETETPS